MKRQNNLRALHKCNIEVRKQQIQQLFQLTIKTIHEHNVETFIQIKHESNMFRLNGHFVTMDEVISFSLFTLDFSSVFIIAVLKLASLNLQLLSIMTQQKTQKT